MLRTRHAILGLLTVVLTIAPLLCAQSSDALAAKIQAVTSCPEFAHSNFGIEFMDLQTGQVVYSLIAYKTLRSASTTKLLTEGTVLAKLGG